MLLFFLYLCLYAFSQLFVQLLSRNQSHATMCVIALLSTVRLEIGFIAGV
jgi:hypothetical protein